MEVAVVEGAQPLFVYLPLGVDSGDVRVDVLELVKMIEKRMEREEEKREREKREMEREK